MSTYANRSKLENIYTRSKQKNKRYFNKLQQYKPEFFDHLIIFIKLKVLYKISYLE